MSTQYFNLKGYEPDCYPSDFGFTTFSRNHLRSLYKAGRKEGYDRELVRGIVVASVLGAVLYHNQLWQEVEEALTPFVVVINADQMAEMTPADHERTWEMGAHRYDPESDPPSGFNSWEDYYR